MQRWEAAAKAAAMFDPRENQRSGPAALTVAAEAVFVYAAVTGLFAPAHQGTTANLAIVLLYVAFFVNYRQARKE